MSEVTREEVWDYIRQAQILGTEQVIIPLPTVKKLLEAARLINELEHLRTRRDKDSKAGEFAAWYQQHIELEKQVTTLANLL